MARALIALGANLGDREQTLAAAVQRLAAAPGARLVARSDWLKTSPIGGPAGQADFLNGAALVDTRLSPTELLAVLLEIEATLGRHRGQRWAARTLDLDLLLYDDQVLSSESLELPHPGLAFRRFMLQPAAQIAAEMTHPRVGWTLGQLVDHLNTSANYLAILGGDRAFRTALAADVARQVGATLVRDPAVAPVQSGGRALELLEQRGQKLAIATTPATNRVVSDFWWEDFPPLLLELAKDEAQTALAAWRRASPDVCRPRLLVVLDDALAVPGELVQTLGTPAQTFCGSLASAVLSQPGNGPFLPVKTPCSLAQAVDEVSAALDAMQ